MLTECEAVRMVAGHAGLSGGKTEKISQWMASRHRYCGPAVQIGRD